MKIQNKQELIDHIFIMLCIVLFAVLVGYSTYWWMGVVAFLNIQFLYPKYITICKDIDEETTNE